VIGELSGIAVEAFRFSFPIAAEGTLWEGCDLQVEVEPVTLFCPPCKAIGKLESIYSFRCPSYGTPTADVRSGKELSLRSTELRQKKRLRHAHSLSGRGHNFVQLGFKSRPGKTELLKRCLIQLRSLGFRPVALVGDFETENDAIRVAESGAPALQIKTYALCHREAEMTERLNTTWRAGI
jgi:hydrogenase nickel incorporation protein HypA/HybF